MRTSISLTKMVSTINLLIHLLVVGLSFVAIAIAVVTYIILILSLLYFATQTTGYIL